MPTPAQIFPARRLAQAALIVALLAALIAPAASAGTLINDPARPFTAAALARMQRWQARAHVLTDPAPVLLSNASCEDIATATACSVGETLVGGQNGGAMLPVGHTWLPAELLDRDVFFHELGRLFNFHVLTDVQRATLLRQFGLRRWADPDPYTFSARSKRAGENVSADAYAMCAAHATWPGRWWHRVTRSARGGTDSSYDTPYRFRAGPKRFAAICAVYRNA